MLRWPLGILAASWRCAASGWRWSTRTGSTTSPGRGCCSASAGCRWWWRSSGPTGGSAGGPTLSGALERHTECVDALPARYDWLWIALAAGLGLYLELVVVRFHASCFQLFAFFKNFSLLSCFLGLGIGYALGSARPLLTPLVLPMLAVQMMFLHALRFTGLAEMLHNPIAEQLAPGAAAERGLVPRGGGVRVPAVRVLLQRAVLYPAGAARVPGDGAAEPRLVAYGWNLLGSLAGIALFFIASARMDAPGRVGGAGRRGAAAVFARHACCRRRLSAPRCWRCWACRSGSDQYDVYSPYQILSVRVGQEPHPEIRVNHDYFQKIWDLRPRGRMWRTAAGRNAKAAQLLQPALRVQAASRRTCWSSARAPGNDVAAAVRNGAGHVDAVEIDPAILRLRAAHAPGAALRVAERARRSTTTPGRPSPHRPRSTT